MPRGTIRARVRAFSFRGMRRGIEAGDRVTHQQQTKQERLEDAVSPPATHRHQLYLLKFVKLNRREKSRLGREGQQRNRQDDRGREDQVAAEIGQHRRHANAEVVEQRLRDDDQRYDNELRDAEICAKQRG